MRFDVLVTTSSPGIVTVLPIGSISNEASAIFLEKAREAIEQKPQMIVLDMRNVNLISSNGLGAIVKAEHEAVSKGISFSLIHVNQNVQKVLQIFRDKNMLKLFADQAELDRYIAKVQLKQ